jgi:hypothetical protein
MKLKSGNNMIAARNIDLEEEKKQIEIGIVHRNSARWCNVEDN